MNSLQCSYAVRNLALGTSWGESLDRESKQNWGWDKVLDVNLKAPFYLTRALVPTLAAAAAASGAHAAIINVGSVAGISPQDTPTHACVYKCTPDCRLSLKESSDWGSVRSHRALLGRAAPRLPRAHPITANEHGHTPAWIRIRERRSECERTEPSLTSLLRQKGIGDSLD
jgi:hypothetical protein